MNNLNNLSKFSISQVLNSSTLLRLGNINDVSIACWNYAPRRCIHLPEVKTLRRLLKLAPYTSSFVIFRESIKQYEKNYFGIINFKKYSKRHFVTMTEKCVSNVDKVKSNLDELKLEVSDSNKLNKEISNKNVDDISVEKLTAHESISPIPKNRTSGLLKLCLTKEHLNKFHSQNIPTIDSTIVNINGVKSEANINLSTVNINSDNSELSDSISHNILSSNKLPNPKISPTKTGPSQVLKKNTPITKKPALEDTLNKNNEISSTCINSAAIIDKYIKYQAFLDAERKKHRGERCKSFAKSTTKEPDFNSSNNQKQAFNKSSSYTIPLLFSVNNSQLVSRNLNYSYVDEINIKIDLDSNCEIKIHESSQPISSESPRLSTCVSTIESPRPSKNVSTQSSSSESLQTSTRELRQPSPSASPKLIMIQKIQPSTSGPPRFSTSRTKKTLNF